MARRGFRSSALPRSGPVLSALPPTDEPAPFLAGKVLDSSALMSWVRGDLAMASWSRLAAGLGLTLLIPSLAHTETLQIRPSDSALVDMLFSQPTVVVVDQPREIDRQLIDARHGEDGVFDPVAFCVVALCRDRGWPALSSDPARLRRIDSSLEVDTL